MCLNSDWTLQARRALLGLHRHVSLRWGMLVSDGSPIRHVDLRGSMSRSLKGLRSSILVSDGSPIGLRWVSDWSPIMIIFS